MAALPVPSGSLAQGFSSPAPGSALPSPPVCAPHVDKLERLFPGPDGKDQVGEIESRTLLELADGSAFEGYTFGADKSITGEVVFQTGKPQATPFPTTARLGIADSLPSRSQEWSATPSP